MMRRIWLVLAYALSLSGAALVVTGSIVAAPAPAPAAPSPQAAETRFIGIWQPPSGLKQVAIWPRAAPDMAGAPRPAENLMIKQTPEAIGGTTSEAVFDVTAPTMTIYPPRGRNTGAAIVVFPGGGFQVLAITIEGTEICDWITAKGITCILSKYRVPNSNHHWDAKCKCAVTPRVAFALQDAQRTIRLVRSQAAALHIDPHRIGVIGFSAGGYLVAQTSNIFAPAYKPVDAVDRISSRPDFALAFYPGHLCRPGNRLDPGIHVTRQTPPTFLIQAWDDPVDDICNSTLYARALDQAGVPSEVHLFAKGGHAFALRRTPHAVTMWPALVERWLVEIGVL